MPNYSKTRVVTFDIGSSSTDIQYTYLSSTLTGLSGVNPSLYTSPISWTFQNEGQNTLYAQLQDYAGNKSNIVSGTVFIDTIAPFFTGISPTDGSLLSTLSLVSGQIYDSGSLINLDSMQVYFDNNAYAGVINKFSIDQYTSGFYFSPAGNDGQHQVSIRCSDYAGNLAQRDINFNLLTGIPAIPGGLSATGVYNGVVLEWDKNASTSLANYELQASGLNSNYWGSLQPYGMTNISGVTQALVNFFVHSKLESDSTQKSGVTFYYRARAVNTVGTVSPWSSSVYGTSTIVDSGDLAANSITASKIQAGAIYAKLIQTQEFNANAIAAGTINSDIVTISGQQGSVIINQNGITVNNGKILINDPYGNTAINGANISTNNLTISNIDILKVVNHMPDYYIRQNEQYYPTIPSMTQVFSPVNTPYDDTDFWGFYTQANDGMYSGNILMYDTNRNSAYPFDTYYVNSGLSAAMSFNNITGYFNISYYSPIRSGSAIVGTTIKYKTLIYNYDGHIFGFADTVNIKSGLYARYRFQDNGSDWGASGINISGLTSPIFSSNNSLNGLVSAGPFNTTSMFIMQTGFMSSCRNENTISMWTNPTSASKSGSYIFYMDNSTSPTLYNNLACYDLTSGQSRYIWTTQSGSSSISLTGYSSFMNWDHHVMARGISGTYFYINGSLVAQSTGYFPIPNMNNASYRYIGGRLLSASDKLSYFSGYIDDMQVYSRALTSGEVLDIYMTSAFPGTNVGTLHDQTIPFSLTSDLRPVITINKNTMQRTLVFTSGDNYSNNTKFGFVSFNEKGQRTGSILWADKTQQIYNDPNITGIALQYDACDTSGYTNVFFSKYNNSEYDTYWYMFNYTSGYNQPTNKLLLLNSGIATTSGANSYISGLPFIGDQVNQFASPRCCVDNNGYINLFMLDVADPNYQPTIFYSKLQQNSYGQTFNPANSITAQPAGFYTPPMDYSYYNVAYSTVQDSICINLTKSTDDDELTNYNFPVGGYRIFSKFYRFTNTTLYGTLQALQ